MRVNIKKTSIVVLCGLILLGTMANASAHSRGCPPGRCCCAKMRASAHGFSHHAGMGAGCRPNVSCCHMKNFNPILNESPVALTSALNHWMPVLASASGKEIPTLKEIDHQHSAQMFLDPVVSDIPLYLRSLAILC